MAQSKTQLLDSIYTLLRKRYKMGPRPEKLSVMESVIYGICHEGTTREQANQTLVRFKDGFFDWNEVRVSPLSQVQTALIGLPDHETRAERLRKFLRQLFSKTYGFNLEQLLKGPQKEAVKNLEEYEALRSDYVLATVLQQGLGGHAIPVDRPMRRALERLGLVEAGSDDASLRASLERAVPKNRGAEFVDLMEELAHDTCVESEPECPRCELRKVCPTAQTRATAKTKPATATAPSAASASPKSKPAPSPPPPTKMKAAPPTKATPTKPAPAAAKGPKAPAAPPPKNRPRPK